MFIIHITQRLWTATCHCLSPMEPVTMLFARCTPNDISRANHHPFMSPKVLAWEWVPVVGECTPN